MPSESRKGATVDFIANKRRVLLPSFHEFTAVSAVSGTERSRSGSGSPIQQQRRRKQQQPLLPGAVKWQHLADQLNLPLALVQQVAERMIHEHNL